jgi:hypothetical protein
MNRNQLITMWCGIATIVMGGLTVIRSYGIVCLYGFSVWVFMAAIVTGGLIYTFRDRKAKNQLQDIRDDILKKRQFVMRKDDPRPADDGSQANTIPTIRQD